MTPILQVGSDSSRPKGELVSITAEGTFKGKVGTLIKDDGSITPFKVKFTDNKEIWFKASDVERSPVSCRLVLFVID